MANDNGDAPDTSASPQLLKPRGRLPHRRYVVTPAAASEYKRVALTLVAAFWDDPFVNYVLRTERLSPTAKRTLYSAYYTHAVWECFALGGTVWVVRDLDYEAQLANSAATHVRRGATTAFVAAATWYNVYGDRRYHDLDLGVVALLLLRHYVRVEVLTWWYQCRRRLSGAMKRLAAVRDSHVTRHQLVSDDTVLWYLDDLGAVPEVHGQGIGTQLLSYCLEQLRQPHAVFYLELSNVANRGFYRKHGFEIVDLEDVSHGKSKLPIVVDAMVRAN